MGDALTDANEVLLRQIHPAFYQNGQPSSQPFQPTPKDDHKLSVDRSALTQASLSHELYTTNGFVSAAVYGIDVGEFGNEALPCMSDPLPNAGLVRANPAHAYADYSLHGSNQQKTKAKRLKLKALGLRK